MVALAPFTTRYAVGGMVCSVDHLASSAGIAMLRAGGNAVDAAIATSAVLAVTTQHMCGMGGDLFALVHGPGFEVPAVLNASGRSGSGASPDRLRDAGFTSVPRRGDIGAVPVPGCVDGWCALHDRFGTLPLADLLEPARLLADDGFAISPTLAMSARGLAAVDSDATRDYPSGEALFPGAVMRRPGVARAMGAVATSGRAGFYEGEFGEGLLALGDGEYVSSDLSTPNAEWVAGLSLDVPRWSRRLWTIPPNSQGYLTLAGAWMASSLPSFPADDPSDPQWAHQLIEVARQAGHDRVDVLHEDADGASLLDASLLATRRDAVSPSRVASFGPGERYVGGGTISLCTADGSGMGVSFIQSNYSGFGSMLIEPSTRIFLQNRGCGFSLEPGHPAEYGPRRRPPHTLAPALVTHLDGTLDCVLGTMGGDSQPQVLLQLLMRRYGMGADPAASLAAARWVLAGAEVGYDVWQAGGDVRVAIEEHAPGGWFPGLEALGHRVVRSRSWGGDFGHAHLISFEPTGALAGAADPRSLGGVALGL
ncbi:MAG TPA: gamma-glutamyltransferase [Acidimicrobiales bacterium]|nr:gamma-glutamyltransferase [Acidimicrobiales bacterium]